MSATAGHDAIVVGSGSAGLTVAIGLAWFGRRVALVERGPVGGDCTNTGCIPSKRLIHLSRDPELCADPERLLARVRETRDGLSARERHEIEQSERIDLVRGRARLAGPGRVVVEDEDGGRELRARHVVVATGSRPRALDIPGLPAERLLTSDDLWDLTRPPGRIAIVGAGAVGVEMAFALSRLGSRVSLVEMADRVLPAAIPEASQALAEALAAAGVEVHTGHRARAYDAAGEALLLDGAGEQGRVAGAERVLAAIGRTPNLEGFAPPLDAGPHGIAVDAWGRTSLRRVWAAGDVTPGVHQTHAAGAHARRVLRRIALPRVPAFGGPPLIPTAVFSDPEVAWAGPSPQALALRHGPGAVMRVRIDLPDTDRGLTDDIVRGFVAVDALRLSGRIVAATVVGPNASDLIVPLAQAMETGVSLHRLRRLVYPYPALAGTIGLVADEFTRRTLPHPLRELGRRLRPGRPRRRR